MPVPAPTDRDVDIAASLGADSGALDVLVFAVDDDLRESTCRSADTEPPGTEVETAVLICCSNSPECPTTKIAAPATATVSPRFTCSPLPDSCGTSALTGRLGSMRVNWTEIQDPEEIIDCVHN